MVILRKGYTLLPSAYIRDNISDNIDHGDFKERLYTFTNSAYSLQKEENN
jgi:hypothetical protein